MNKTVLVMVALIACACPTALGKNAGDLLSQYLGEKPTSVTNNEVLALVEIVSVDLESPAKGGWHQTGTLKLKLIESVDKSLPKVFTVQFKKRDPNALRDAWTWDQAELKKGRRLLGFFNGWNDVLAVREDGRTNVINNPENIEKNLLKRAQKRFKTPLLPQKGPNP